MMLLFWVVIIVLLLSRGLLIPVQLNAISHDRCLDTLRVDRKIETASSSVDKITDQFVSI